MAGHEALRAAIEDGEGRLREAAAMTFAAYPELSDGIGDEDIDQLLHAFRALMLEEIVGEGETRQLFLETAIPAYLAESRPALSMILSNTYFAVYVTDCLTSAVPEDERKAARDWLARFWSRWVHDVAERALAEERE